MTEESSYFPVFIDLRKERIIMVGGGKIATRRIHTMLPFVSEITVIAPEISEEILSEINTGSRIIWKQKQVELTDLLPATLVFAATDSAEINDMVVDYCRKHHINVNHAGDKEQCDFYFPGIARRDEVVVGVTASGKNHKKARQVTEAVQSLLNSIWK